MVSSSFSQLSATLAKAWLPTWRDLGFASSDARHLLVSGDGMGHPFNGYAHDYCLWASVNWFFIMYIFGCNWVSDAVVHCTLLLWIRKPLFKRWFFLKTCGHCSAHGHFIRLFGQNDVSFLKTIAIFRRISLGPHFQRIANITEKWCCPQRTDAWEAFWSQPSSSWLQARASIKGGLLILYVLIKQTLTRLVLPGLSINIRSSHPT